MMEELLRDVLVAAGQLTAFWLVLKAELRSLWRASDDHTDRIKRLEGKFIGGR